MGINASGGCYNSLSEWENDVAATRAAGLNPDLVAGFRMESADNNNPLPGDSTYWFTLLESAPAPAPPSSSDVFTYVYMEIYDTADVRLDRYLSH